MALGLSFLQYTLPPPHTILLQLLVSSAVVGFSPPHSLVRPAALPLVVTCVYGIVSTTNLHMRARWASLIGGTSFAFLLQYIDLALLGRWSFKDRGPASDVHHGTPTRNSQSENLTFIRGQKSTNGCTTISNLRVSQNAEFWDRLWFGWCNMFAFRHLDSKYETKNVPVFSKKDPSYIPPRWQFVLRRIFFGTICYLLIDLSSARQPPKNSAALFDVALVPLFRRLGSVSSGEMKLRVVSTVGFWVTLYCVIEGGNALASAIAVSLGLSKVRDWRPTFGSFSEAYTLRNFWGKSWHQSLRRMFTEPSHFMTHTALHLRKGSFAARYLNLFLTFAISGIMHSVASISSGMPIHEYGVFQFFCTQVLGIMIEDGVQACYRRLQPDSDKNSAARAPTYTIRCLGYVWVTAFLVWSTPAWFYARRPRLAASPTNFLPFSVVQALRS